MFGVKDLVMLICGLHCSPKRATSASVRARTTFSQVFAKLVSPHPGASRACGAGTPEDSRPPRVAGRRVTPTPSSQFLFRQAADAEASAGGGSGCAWRPL